MPAQAFLGVDWGTHSSKWCYQDTTGHVLVGPIWDSRVWRLDGELAMFPLDERFQGAHGEDALKRKLIQDPGQPFWEGTRQALRCTLGEAVVFSLLTILHDALETIEKKGVSSPAPLTVRFSHPNWIEADAINALRYYRDAAVVALSLTKQSSGIAKQGGGWKMAISELRERIGANRHHLEKLPGFPEEYDFAAFEKCLSGSIDGVHWQFIFESCAAGFPYLVEGEPEHYAKPRYDQVSVRKLLVVDIGAGSTDAGYMLRTVQLQSGVPLLVWLPPSAALDRAGRWLTEKVLADWAQSGRRATFIEAELYKTSGTSEWHKKPFVAEWCESISSHVGHYTTMIPDTDRLPSLPPLEVVVTGGSSAVGPVKTALKNAVIGALEHLKVPPAVRSGTALLDLQGSLLPGRRYSAVQVAQLAVALGASSPRLSELRYYPDGMLSGAEMVKRMVQRIKKKHTGAR